MSRLGASRMSSVFGLKLSPSTPIIDILRQHRRMLFRNRVRCMCVDAVRRLHDRQIHVVFLGRGHQCLHIFGEAAAAVADAGMQEARADAVIQSHALPDSADVPAGAFASSVIMLMKLILVARNALLAYFTISALSRLMKTSGLPTRVMGR